jgi:hypothetical protein
MLATFTSVLLFAMVKTYLIAVLPDLRPFWWLPIVIGEGGAFGAVIGMLLERQAR